MEELLNGEDERLAQALQNEQLKWQPEENHLLFERNCKTCEEYIKSSSEGVFPAYSWKDFHDKEYKHKIYAAILAGRLIKEFFVLFQGYNELSWKEGGESEYDDNNYYTTQECADYDYLRIDGSDAYDFGQGEEGEFLISKLGSAMYMLDQESLQYLWDSEAATCKRDEIDKILADLESSYQSLNKTSTDK